MGRESARLEPERAPGKQVTGTEYSVKHDCVGLGELAWSPGLAEKNLLLAARLAV